GPGVIEPFVRRIAEHVTAGRVTPKFRHRASRLLTVNGTVTGVAGELLAPSTAARGEQSGRDIVGGFEFGAQATIVTSGGIGGDFERVRRCWPVERLGPAPRHMVAGVPHHVDGRMLDVAQAAGAALIN